VAARRPIFTTTPDVPAPALFCPLCDELLDYRQTVVSGVQPIERWDYYECPTCGTFDYRHRTRKIRHAEFHFGPVRPRPA
jgi:hypothetical protein